MASMFSNHPPPRPGATPRGPEDARCAVGIDRGVWAQTGVFRGQFDVAHALSNRLSRALHQVF